MTEPTFPVTATATPSNNTNDHHELHNGDDAVLYAAPTLDTLDDASLFLRQHPNLNDKDNNRQRLYFDDESGVTRHLVSFTPSTVQSPFSFNQTHYDYHHAAHSPEKKNKANGNQATTNKNTGTSGLNASATEKERSRTASNTRKRRKPQGDFQQKEDCMTVAVRPVNIAQRSAFGLANVASVHEWQIMAKRLEQKAQASSSGSLNSSNASINAAQKKLSPSLQHLRLLQAMQSMTTIRQLAFSPSVGIDSDVFVPWWEYLQQVESNGAAKDDQREQSPAGSQPTLKRRVSNMAGELRDGRYRSIHPVQATLSALPPVPPALSNKKLRLPMRSDVGFPSPTEAEILQKQAEINQESVWEEASPRIIVLVTSDDLGTAVQDEDVAAITPAHWEWNGGGLQNMPWAGRDLLRAKELNALHFSRKTSILTNKRHSLLATTSNDANFDDASENHDNATAVKMRLLEPNRTSILAPPLDASFSKTLGWRPRPFHDRPAGMKYLLCWPLDVSFQTGNMEPLLCSLALYNLPNNSSKTPVTNGGTNNNIVYGKISEEFWFPAGDWEGKVELHPSLFRIPSTKNINSSSNNNSDMATPIEEKDFESFWKRKQKAIFSYDPLAIRGGAESLFWVLQVFRVADDDSAAIYDSNTKGGNNQGGKRSKSVTNLFKGKSPVKQRSDSCLQQSQEAANGARMHANQFFEKHGTNLMTPLGFGIQSAIPSASDSPKNMDYPRGAVREMAMFKSSMESQEQFVHRLSDLVSSITRSNGQANGIPSSDYLQSFSEEGAGAFDMSPITSTVSDRPSNLINHSASASASDSQTIKKSIENKPSSSPLVGRKKKSMAKRIWLSPVKATRSLTCSSSSSNATQSSARSKITTTGGDNTKGNSSSNNCALAATVSIFSSTLKTDWLQSMLSDPTDMEGFKLFPHPQPTFNSSVPKLLCDVSGDFAVMLEDRGTSKKRSNLSRLPAHQQRAGYSGPAEIREVQFLPARPDKQYDLDVPPSYRSLVNLLYLYPRLLRSSSENESGKKQKKREPRTAHRYCVRIRLVQSSLEVGGAGNVASSNTTLDAFHSPSPWAGSPLVKEVYTKVPVDQPCTKQSKGGKVEQHMRDEFKLHLPPIIDPSFFLQFTLYAIEPADDGKGGSVSYRAIGESSIPLSSSSVRDSTGGIKVQTVIPNGTHRIALGDFRFYVESRLLSSVHIGDAALAAAVRDFPVNSRANDAGHLDSSCVSSLARLGNDNGVTSPPDTAIRFPALFANASDGTLVGQFPILMYIHLGNLLRSVPLSADLMMGNLESLFAIFRKVKRCLNPESQRSRGRLDIFLKKVMDEYEESFLLLASGDSSNRDEEEQASDLGSEAGLDESNIGSAVLEGSSVNGEAIDDDLLDDGAVRVRHKDSLRTGIEKRLIRRKSAGVGFKASSSLSRVAYGASKTDRMKIEAEMYYNQSSERYSHLYDDDETIGTSGTALYNIQDRKQRQKAAALESEQNEKALATEQKNTVEADGSIRAATAAASRTSEKQAKSDANQAGDGFATRVKSVAKVMLAPCVGSKSDSSVSPRRLSLDCGRSSRERRNSSVSDSNSTAKKAQLSDEKTPKETSEETFFLPGSDDEDDTNAAPTRYSAFRGFQGGPILEFSPRLNKNDSSITGGKYVYESILFLWLQAWSEFSDKNPGDFPNFSSNSCTLCQFFEHSQILLPLFLKSFSFRHSVEVQEPSDDNAYTKAVLDYPHMSALKQLVEILARSLMGQALSKSKSPSLGKRNCSLLQALASSDLILDFFVGLFALLHPEHMRSLLEKWFKTLNDCEEHTKENSNGMLEFHWTEESIRRVKCSRQLRLRAVEKLSVLPAFLSLNFPLKFADRPTTSQSGSLDKPTWKMQYIENANDDICPKHIYQSYGYASGDSRRPGSGWLARLLAQEGLSVCSLSCEAVVAQAMAQIESSDKNQVKDDGSKSTKQQTSLQLARADLLAFQSLAIHAITAVYELLFRRHAMDTRFQTDVLRGRIAAMFTDTLFTMSLQSVRWLSRMESTHKVRSVWMLCLIYILQEAPEVLIRHLVRSYCDPSDMLIHRFIRLLRLASSTFQSFVDQPRHSTFPNEIDKTISPWLLQESFNTICASANIVVEECVELTKSNPKEQRKMIHAVLDLFLHILTTPQSAVTHLRAVGGALQALDQFGVEIFLDVVGDNLQHWIRILQSLLNHTSLSVRSIAVDFVLSLLGGLFDLQGTVDDILLVFASVLPEVVARELALFSVDGHIENFNSLAQCLWPLRRSFAEIEDANPLDDDRIDPELSPALKMFGRAQQAIVDGVLIELRLRRDKCFVVGKKIEVPPMNKHTFDADEESLFEASEFFMPETAPMQRLRWLLSLKALHEAKNQPVEAAEVLISCAKTILYGIPLEHVWRPTRFLLWSDQRRSTWLSTVGEEMGHPDRGNSAVMAFADEFLEPNGILDAQGARSTSGRLQQPTLCTMCTKLSAIAKDAVNCYLKEDGMAEIAYSRLENLLRAVMDALSDHGSLSLEHGRSFSGKNVAIRKRHVEDETALRRVCASLSLEMTRLAEKLLLLVQDEPGSPTKETEIQEAKARPFYVLVAISGHKPASFQSMTIPSFLEWNEPCVCRVPPRILENARQQAGNDLQLLKKHVCLEYGKPLQRAIADHGSPDSVVLGQGSNPEDVANRDSSKTYIDVSMLYLDCRLDSAIESTSVPLQSKRFFYPQAGEPDESLAAKNLVPMVEVTVAHTFPSHLSRQRILLTKEFTYRMDQNSNTD